MKRKVRRGVFETNSSSVHSLTMCMEDEYDRWVAGELVFDRWNKKIVPITDKIKESIDAEYTDYLTYDQFSDLDFETFEESFTTPNKETVVAIGYYGHY